MNFHASLFVFVLQRKMQGSRMSKHGNKRYVVCRTKSMLNAYAWWCNDSCKMWCWNMITDKCRNDMFIMMPWRDAYAMHDMNAFMDTRARKIISSYLRIWGRSAPCVQLRRWYGPSDASSIGACRPRIFFINGFLCFLEDKWQRNGEGRERGDATSRRRWV